MSIDIFLHALTSYFVIIDPIGAALIFNSLTSTGSNKYALNMAVRTVVISILIVLVFGLFGESFLTSLGISIEALRVSGGLLLFYTAFNMVTKSTSGGKLESNGITDISVYPMSIPMIAGPGCLTLTILLFSEASGTSDLIAVSGAVLLIYLTTFVCFLLSRKIKEIIGTTGDDIIRRLFGVILAALAVQFIADGIRQLSS